MDLKVWFLPLFFVGTTVVLSIPVGYYLAWIIDGRYQAPAWLKWIEARFDTGPQNWKQYTVALLLFNTVMFLAAFLFLSVQSVVPFGNPDDKQLLSPTMVFNTTSSFLTNTNLQHYSGEQHLSYWSQLTA